MDVEFLKSVIKMPQLNSDALVIFLAKSGE